MTVCVSQVLLRLSLFSRSPPLTSDEVAAAPLALCAAAVLPLSPLWQQDVSRTLATDVRHPLKPRWANSSVRSSRDNSPSLAAALSAQVISIFHTRHHHHQRLCYVLTISSGTLNLALPLMKTTLDRLSALQPILSFRNPEREREE